MENTNTATNTDKDTVTKDFNFAEDFEAAKTFVADLGARIPKRAIYWGLGAAVIGVAAVAAVMYRNRISASNREFSKSQDFGKNPDVRNAAEADPDFADTSIGRQPLKTDATLGDRNLVFDTHH
jgi:hypothetical protein